MIRFPPLPLVLTTLLLRAGAMCAEPSYPQVFRTFMPEAGPSAFGVILSPGLAICYDPLRGGVSEAWLGTLDLSPTLQAKINKPAAIQGRIFYKESGFQPIRLDPAKAPERRFKGYQYEAGAVTFHYTLNGKPVAETIRVADAGSVIERKWSTAPGVTLYFLAEPQAGAQVMFAGASETSPGIWKSADSEGQGLTMRIRFDAAE